MQKQNLSDPKLRFLQISHGSIYPTCGHILHWYFLPDPPPPPPLACCICPVAPFDPILAVAALIGCGTTSMPPGPVLAPLTPAAEEGTVEEAGGDDEAEELLRAWPP